MAKTKKCPACRTEVDAEEQHCPNCPHSFYQEEGVQEQRKGRSRQPVLWFAAAVLFFVAAAKLLSFVMKYADADDAKNNPFSEAVQSASTAAPAGAAPGSPEEAAAKAQQQAEEEARIALSHGRVKLMTENGTALPPQATSEPAPAQAGQEPTAATGQDAASEEPVAVLTAPSGSDGEQAPAKEWRLRGHIYDLVTLKPVSHATLVLKDAELNRRFELMTGADGRYRTIVPSLPGRGYAVAISAPDYAVTYLDPRTEARAKSLRERREMAEELTHALDAPFSLRALSKAPVETDFYLAPSQP